MPPRILVLYYSQTGQLARVMERIVAGIGSGAEVDVVDIKPIAPFPFPWGKTAFFDVLPEAVAQVAIPIQPLPAFVKERSYDLVILGYQPWFLHPSLPVCGLLKGEWGHVLQGRPVVTVSGSCNMWLNAQEQVKGHLRALGAPLVGHIALTDRELFIRSIPATVRWQTKGHKVGSDLIPNAGVKDKHVAEADRFGQTISKHVADDNLIDLQRALLDQGAVHIGMRSIIMERCALKQVRYWAKVMSAKGGPGAEARKPTIRLFSSLLNLSLFILPLFCTLSALYKLLIKKHSLLKDVEYFRQINHEEGRM